MCQDNATSTSSDVEDITLEKLLEVAEFIKSLGVKPGDPDIELTLPSGESIDDPSLQDDIGKAIEAGFGYAEGVTVKVTKAS